MYIEGGWHLQKNAHESREAFECINIYIIYIRTHKNHIYIFSYVCIGGGELQEHGDEMKHTGVTGKDKRILSATNSAIQ